MTSLSILRAALENLQVVEDIESRAPSQSVAVDTELGRAVGAGIRPPTFRIWENRQALVVTAREARLPDFGRASEILESEGWPVVLRDSGGTAVPHGPGILQASLVLPQSRLPTRALEAVYKALCRPARVALAQFGIQATYGEVPGSFCDGRFNLVAGSRKIAGTSQRWKSGPPPHGRAHGYVLAHMVLFVQADMTRGTEIVNRLYALAGGARQFDPAAVTSAAQLNPVAATPPNPRLVRGVWDAMVQEAKRLTTPALPDAPRMS